MATARQGRAGNGPAATPFDTARGQPDHLHTHMTGAPGGTPTGEPTEITEAMRRDVEDRSDNRRSVDRENAAAVAIAAAGYQIKQNPTPAEVAQARLDTGDLGNPAKNPDYLVEGRVFDCYSPKPDKPVRGVWWQTKDKIDKLQTQRVFIDLVHWRGDMADLQKQFDDWPIPNVKEVKAILPNGEIVQIHLPKSND